MEQSGSVKDEFLPQSIFFGELIYSERTAQGLRLGQLGEGLYSTSMMKKIEQGRCFPEKMMRDRLLARLGMQDSWCELYVFQTEYEKWKQRTRLFVALKENALEAAEQLLQESGMKRMGNKAEAQFFLVMQLWLLQKKKFPKQIWFPVLEQAIRLTVPQFQKKPLTKLVLSPEEQYLLLKYRFYQENTWDEEAVSREADYACFFEEMRLCSINFVIRARRKIFGLKRKEFESICSLRTLQRIENGSGRIQLSIAEALLQKVGISMEPQKNGLQNRQRMACEEAIRLWDNGNFSKAEYLQRLKGILEMTIPLEATLQPIQDRLLSNGRKQVGEKYLTTQEVIILDLLAKETMEPEQRSRYQHALEEYAAWMCEQIG